MTAVRACHSKLRLVALVLCLTWSFSGCGGKVELPAFHADLVPVSGTVTLKKQPLARASITFFPIGDNAMQAAYALTDELGHYQAMTPIHGLPPDRSRGIIPGKYKVVISKMLMPNGSAIPAGMTDADAMQQGAKESLHPRFSSDEKTTLSADVAQGSSPLDLNFEL